MPQTAGASMRAVVLTIRGLAVTNHLWGNRDYDVREVCLDDERPNPFGLVRPRCYRCCRRLGLCPGHGNNELPADTP